jgi:DNA-binding PadR family transcriptional regulator
VRSRWEAERTAARDGRPARRYYELTASGVKALEAALDTLQQLDAARLRVKHAR